MPVQPPQFFEASQENSSLVPASDPFCVRCLTFCCEAAHTLVVHLENRLRSEQIWKLIDKTRFNGKNDDIVDKLLQSNLCIS